MVITITDKRTEARIKELAEQSGTHPSTWVQQVLEDWLQLHRSGRFTADPAHYTSRNGDDYSEFANRIP
jgi:hypothetical protein